MDDDTLAGYIPTYGDWIAARRFCLENQGASAKESNKHSLLEKLKKKIGIAGNDDEKSHHEENTAAKQKRGYAKKTKKQMGWKKDQKS